ncbi:hypothetical protein B0H66DRAFT_573601 [Apodospora peruviana]|uniref:SET domain-containing protein n=1 Tax=Apodospora peruviana TaxID=516989 RepID=A0AAE0MCD8_9PEZI|nr:hypothetical protein B0H66DRAFT_573601 [Apodospora peruviana]
MLPPHLPIEALPAWALLNDVAFVDVKVKAIEGKGYGLVCDRKLSTKEDTFDLPTLVTVPHNLVLNIEAVEEYAKEDRNFKQLLDVAGHHSARGTILLFLLVQTVLASRTSASEPAATGHSSVGVSNPWTEYVKFLPDPLDLLVPTLWTEHERLLLRGTSLESAVKAKISALTAEFLAVREASSDILVWNEMLWEREMVGFRDWIFLDAVYRSRCLELPRSGQSMVPCIDMINHSANPTVYYDENARDETVLLLRPDTDVSSGEEVTISYGDAKSAAEMLFSYGFVDPASTAGEDSLVLPLDPFPDDPLAKAKLVTFGKPPKIHVARDKGSGAVRWKSPFAYLMCVNEEDGLEFRVLQDNDGNRQLRIFWLDEDVTERTTDFETLIRNHKELSALLSLRTVTVVQESLQAQLDSLGFNSELDSMTPSDLPLVREGCLSSAILLRQSETDILRSAIEALEKERCTLLEDKTVVAYLGSMETAKSDLVDEEASNEDDDFS